MGGCASRPKESDAKREPLLVEEPTTPQKPKADDIAPQEDNGGETKKEEALLESPQPAEEATKIKELLVETSQPAEEAPESKEPSTESKPSEETAKPKEGKVEAAEEKNEPAEEKKVQGDGEKKLAE